MATANSSSAGKLSVEWSLGRSYGCHSGGQGLGRGWPGGPSAASPGFVDLGPILAPIAPFLAFCSSHPLNLSSPKPHHIIPGPLLFYIFPFPPSNSIHSLLPIFREGSGKGKEQLVFRSQPSFPSISPRNILFSCQQTDSSRPTRDEIPGRTCQPFPLSPGQFHCSESHFIETQRVKKVCFV